MNMEVLKRAAVPVRETYCLSFLSLINKNPNFVKLLENTLNKKLDEMMIFSRLDTGGENDLDRIRFDNARRYLTRVYATSPDDMHALNVFDTTVELSDTNRDGYDPDDFPYKERCIVQNTVHPQIPIVIFDSVPDEENQGTKCHVSDTLYIF